MYAGRIVEEGPVDAIFEAPQHPYTLGLLRSTPRLEEHVEALRVIPGQPPNLQALPPGCSFNDRCPFAFERCLAERPRLRPLRARPPQGLPSGGAAVSDQLLSVEERARALPARGRRLAAAAAGCR